MAKRLKDIFFQKPFFDSLAAEIGKVHRGFDQRRFARLVMDQGWKQRALKARMRHAAEVLGETLPTDFPAALAILMKVEGKYEGFDHLVFADFVERFGVDHFAESMDALEVLTRTTAEFAVRPFIIRYPKRAMARMGEWVTQGLSDSPGDAGGR